MEVYKKPETLKNTDISLIDMPVLVIIEMEVLFSYFTQRTDYSLTDHFFNDALDHIHDD